MLSKCKSRDLNPSKIQLHLSLQLKNSPEVNSNTVSYWKAQLRPLSHLGTGCHKVYKTPIEEK